MIRRAYVIRPVGSDPLASEKMKAIVEGAGRAGFDAGFPLYLPLKPSFHLPDVIAEIREAHAIIADLSY